MTDTSPSPVRVVVYGSCVARDTVEFAAPESVDLRGYIARQSLISTGSDASRHLPDEFALPSKFQERMIRADFAGGLFTRLETMAADIDVLLWDLADERHGVYRFSDGTTATRSIDTIRIPQLMRVLSEAEHIPFGTDEHFEIWCAHVDKFEKKLRELGIFDTTVVLNVPWAMRTSEGAPAPSSMGVFPMDANKRYVAYYERLAERGFHTIELREGSVFADPGHRWGLAPFHYSPTVYEDILGRLASRPRLHHIRTRP